MESSAETSRALPASWMAVLDEVLHEIRRAEAEAAGRERALAGPPVSDPAGPDREAARRDCLGRLQERLRGLEAWAETLREGAAETEAALDAGEDLARRWLDGCRAAAQKLATRPAGSV